MAEGSIDWVQCLERVREHDEAASRDLVEALYPTVIRIVRSHLPRRAAEEDLAQEVFVKLFAKLDQYQSRNDIPFDHWVSRLAVRTCLDALRAERRRPEWRWSDLAPEESEWLSYLAEATAECPATDASDAREILVKLMEQLAPADRLVITLLDLEQRSVRDIAALTGWSTALVKVRAFRARHKLRGFAAAFGKDVRHECFQ